MCKWMCWLTHTHPCDRFKLLKNPYSRFIPIHSSFHTHTHTHTHRRRVGTHTGTLGHWGNDNKDMLMCANDVVISWRVQMEREINTDATGSEVWVHWHVCACVCWRWSMCLLYGRLLRQLCVHVCVTPGFHQTPLPLELWPPPPAQHPTGRRANPGGAGECVCVCVSQMSRTVFFCLFFFVCVFLWTALCSIWIFSWVKTRAHNKLSCSCHKLTYIHLTPRRVI